MDYHIRLRWAFILSHKYFGHQDMAFISSVLKLVWLWVCKSVTVSTVQTPRNKDGSLCIHICGMPRIVNG